MIGANCLILMSLKLFWSVKALRILYALTMNSASFINVPKDASWVSKVAKVQGVNDGIH